MKALKLFSKNILRKSTLGLLIFSLLMPLMSFSFTPTAIAAEEFLVIKANASVVFEEVASKIRLEVKIKNTTQEKDLGGETVEVSCSNEESNFGQDPANCFTQKFEAWTKIDASSLSKGDILEIEVINRTHTSVAKKTIAYTGDRDRTERTNPMLIEAGNFNVKMAAGDVWKLVRSYFRSEINYENKEKYIKWMTWPTSIIKKYPTDDPDNWKFFVKDGDDQVLYERWMTNIKELEPGQVYTEKEVQTALPSAMRGNWFTKMLLAVLGLMASFLATIISLILKIIVYLLAQIDAGYKNPIIVDMWKNIRDLLNLVFIVALFTMALSNLIGFQKDNYGIKQGLPKLILMVVAVNFSYLFVGVVLDAANVIEAAVYSLADMGPHGSGYLGSQCSAALWTESGSLPCRLMTIFNTQQVEAVGPYISENLTGGIGGTEIVIAALGMLLLMIGVMIALLGVALVFLVRTIALWFLTITSPIFFVGYAFQPLKNYADKWKENFLKYAFMHVKFAFFLSIGIRLVESFAVSYQGGTEYYSVSPDENFIPGVVSLGGQNDPITMNSFLMMLFMFACIWMGVFSSMKSDISAVDGIAEKFKGAGNSTMKFLGKKSTLNWGQDIGVPGGGIGKYVGLKNGLTVRDIGKGFQNFYEQRKHNLEIMSDNRAGMFGSKVTGVAEKLGKGVSYIPVMGGWVQQQAVGIIPGDKTSQERANLETEVSKASDRYKNLSTKEILDNNLLQLSIDSGRRGDAIAIVRRLGENQDNAHTMNAGLKQLTLRGDISLDMAAGIGEEFKGFHSGMLHLKDSADGIKAYLESQGIKPTAKAMKKAFKELMKINEMGSSVNVKDAIKRDEQLFMEGRYLTLDGKKLSATEGANAAADLQKRDQAQRDMEVNTSTNRQLDMEKRRQLHSRKQDGTRYTPANTAERGLGKLLAQAELLIAPSKATEAANLNLDRTPAAQLDITNKIKDELSLWSKGEIESLKGRLASATDPGMRWAFLTEAEQQDPAIDQKALALSRVDKYIDSNASNRAAVGTEINPEMIKRMGGMSKVGY